MDELDNVENLISDDKEIENIIIHDEQSLLDLKDRQLLDNELYKLLHVSPFGAVVQFKLSKDSSFKVLFSIESSHLNYSHEFSGDSIDEILEEIEFRFMKVLKKWKANRF